MKKPVEYLKDLFEEPYNLEESSIESDFLATIKQAQVDIIDLLLREVVIESVNYSIPDTFVQGIIGITNDMKDEISK